ncbi:hypothetical protein BV20DRAFT_966564 [Pilatotrama ljubarskyi]|nr:hypothetical protein BV20DRAFT_966564 [Pilatotrama ljubarskyi]
MWFRFKRMRSRRGWRSTSVGLRSNPKLTRHCLRVPVAHLFAATLEGSDTIMSRTRPYNVRPLAVQVAGAGVDVADTEVMSASS